MLKDTALEFGTRFKEQHARNLHSEGILLCTVSSLLSSPEKSLKNPTC